MEGLIQSFLDALMPMLATVIGGFVIAWLHKARQKMGLQADAEQDAKVRSLVQNAILSTEERIRAEAVKRLAGVGAGHTSAAKMHETVGKVMDTVPGITSEAATALVNEELPKVRKAVAPVVALPVAPPFPPAAPPPP